MSNDALQFGDVDGSVNIIQGQMTAGGDIIAGNKTVIQNIIQQAAKQIVTAPYKFLASYDISDRDIFFGRKQVIEELVGEIPRHKSLLINGRSGSGKTSLINAGLIPRLAENGYVYVSFRDYRDPLRQLREHLRQHDTFKLDHTESLPLLGILQALSQQQDSRVLVVFDQFERFFVGVSADLRTQFIQEFKVCLESGLSAEEMNVVFSIRQDFFGRLVDEFDSAIPTFFAESARYTLRPLSLAEAREAIVKPLKFVPNLFYNEGFMDDVLLPSLMGQTPDGQQIEPPHLQIVCNQLYEEVRKRHAVDLESGEKPIFIGYDLYHDLGETQGILHNYLDDVVARMTGNNPDRMAIVRSILKLMIETVGTRKFVSLANLAAGLPDVPQIELNAITSQLQNGRVVEVRGQGQQASYSLSHEFMVEKVQSWYDEREMQRQKARETLERGVAEWKNTQALFNEKQVQAIRKWLATEELSQDAEQVLTESQQAYEERKQKEAEQLHRIALGKRLLGGVIIVALMVAGILTFWAMLNAREAARQANFAKQEQQTSRSRELAAVAITALEIDPTSSFRLAEKALHIMPENRLAQQTLFQTLEYPFHNILQGHVAEVWSAVFSPDGTRVITQSSGEVRIWDAVTGRLLHDLDARDVENMVLSPNGKHIVTLSPFGDPRLWDWNTAEEIPWPISEKAVHIGNLCFSPDGERIVIIPDMEEGPFGLFDVMTGQELFRIGGASPFGAEFSPDGALIVTTSEDGIQVWDASTGKQLVWIENEYAYGSRGRMIFSPDSTRIVTTGWEQNNRVLHLLDVSNGKELSRFAGHTQRLTGSVFSPNGKLLVTSSEDATARLWNLDTGEEIFRFTGHTQGVTSVVFSPDGKLILTASRDGTARVWNVDTGTEILRLIGHTQGLTSAIFSPDGQRIVTTSQDHTVRIWELDQQWELHSFTILDKGMYKSVFSQDGTRMAIFSQDEKTVHIRNTATGQQLSTLTGGIEHVENMMFSPDNTRIVTIHDYSDSPPARVWNADTGEELVRLPSSRAFLLDDTRILSASSDGDFRILNSNTGAELLQLSQSEEISQISESVNSLWDAVLSPNGAWIATTAYSSIVIWDAATGRETLRVILNEKESGHSTVFSDGARLTYFALDTTIPQPYKLDIEGHLGKIVFSPDSTKFAFTSDDDFAARVWDINTGSELLCLVGHTSKLGNMMFSSDGSRLVTAEGRGPVRVWDADTGDELLQLSAKAEKIFLVAGTRILIATADHRIRGWSVTTGEEIFQLSGHTAPLLDATISPDGTRMITVAQDKTLKIWPATWQEVIYVINEKQVRGVVRQLTEEEKKAYGFSD